MTKLVSILMPLYNAEKWLAQTIESVLAQRYFNWELIIVDDGSTDNSYEIAQTFAKKDNRIKVYKQKNKGACAARNKAFELSKGDYIQYLDADDLLSECKLEYQLNKLIKENDINAIASCKWEVFNNTVGYIPPNIENLNKSYEVPLNWLVEAWTFGGFGVVMMWLIPRHLILKAGKWNESLIVNQDGEFFCRVLLIASQVKFVEEVYVYYRMGNSNSISQAKPSSEKAKSKLKTYLLYQQHLSSYINQSKVQTALAANYIKFSAEFEVSYPELSKISKCQLKTLPLANRRLIYKRWLPFFVLFIGFNNYLLVKKLIYKTTQLFNLNGVFFRN